MMRRNKQLLINFMYYKEDKSGVAGISLKSRNLIFDVRSLTLRKFSKPNGHSLHDRVFCLLKIHLKNL